MGAKYAHKDNPLLKTEFHLHVLLVPPTNFRHFSGKKKNLYFSKPMRSRSVAFESITAHF